MEEEGDEVGEEEGRDGKEQVEQEGDEYKMMEKNRKTKGRKRRRR
jgi:hypothetical protein